MNTLSTGMWIDCVGIGVAPAARDFADWKKKNGVPAEGKVFSMTGWWEHVFDMLHVLWSGGWMDDVVHCAYGVVGIHA